jgi:hypothetical protein
MEFHIGDEVEVVGQQLPIHFTVTNICRDAHGHRFYSGQGPSAMAAKWWDEDNLDYRLDPEVRSAAIRLEADLQELQVTKGNIIDKWKWLNDALTPSLRSKYHRLVGGAMGWSGWDEK